METIDLYFTALCKHGQVLEVRKGPFPNSYEAISELQDEGGNCYQRVIKVTLPCEICT